tara:strand:+ start:1805 stop:2437 length:633 start_codon:yes stop_codon:yes gene_type:complete
MVEIIAIDGPASVGKSTLAKKISIYYESPLLNSGKLYRAIAAKIKNKNIKINDKNKIVEAAKKLSKADINSKYLFETGVDSIASKISARKYLRDELKAYQRSFPRVYGKGKKFTIIEGRDIGTEIFPEAKYKIFLWADARMRSMRRYEQTLKKGEKAGLAQIYNEIIIRDYKDLNRKIAPLRPAVNSVLLDTTYLDIEQAFNAVKKIINK